MGTHQSKYCIVFGFNPDFFSFYHVLDYLLNKKLIFFKRLNEIKFEEYFVEINWEVGGCLKVSSAILLWKDHDPLDIKENFDGYNFTYVNSSYEWHRIQNINNNFSKISSKFKFKNQFDLNSSQKIDILIAMQCDQEWGKIKENSVPLAPPQSHLVQSRTKDDYFVKNNGFKIFSDKTVYKFLKKITNTEYKIKNEYISQVEVKFHKCSSFGSKKDYEENNFLIFTNSLNKIEIKGNIKYFSNKFAATLFNNGDISSCDSIHLGRNLNVFNEKFQQKTLDLLNYEKSSTVFLENNESSDYLSLSVSKKQFLNTSVLNMMLGHSLLLSNSNDKKDVLIGQVRIIQKYQCEEEAKNCVGAELNNDGLCLLMDEFKMDKKDDYLIKIAIKPNEYNQTVYIKILADLKRLSFIYDQINKIIIRNQDTQIDFLIKEGKVMPSNIFLSESKSFNLELKNALSNKLVIYIEKGGQQFKIGLCDIVYVENLVLYLEDGIDNTMNEESMKKESNIVVLIMTNLAAFIFLIFLIFSIRISFIYFNFFR